jgi:ABC-2 type transport system permease protein
MNAVWLIARKDLRQRLRDRSAIVLAVVLPLALAIIYNLIFGSAAAPRPFRFAVVDLDRGQVAQGFTGQMLAPMEREGLIELRAVNTRDEAWALASDGTIDAAFIVPQGFPQSAGIEVIGGADAPTGTDVAGAIARSYATEVDFLRLAVAAAGPGDSSPQELAERAAATARPLVLQDVSAAEKILGIKAYFAAGMAVFFLFFTVQYGVSSILDERQLGTLQRLLAAPITARSVLAGKLTTSFLLGMISTAVLLLATWLLMGVAWGDPLGVAILVVAGVTAATGVTALVASLARTPELAGSWQSVIAVVLGLLGGAFFPISQVGGVVAKLSLITPHAWFLRGLAELAGGGSARAVLPAAAVMLAFAAVTMGIALIRLSKVVRP